MPASHGMGSGTAIMPGVAALPLCVVPMAAVRPHEEDAWARLAVVLASCAVLTVAVWPLGEFVVRTGAPVVPSCGSPVAGSSFAGASWNVKASFSGTPDRRKRQPFPPIRTVSHDPTG